MRVRDKENERDIRDLSVSATGDLISELDNGHIGAQTLPHRTLAARSGARVRERDRFGEEAYHLEANDAAADDGQALRDSGERERAGGRDDRLLVDLRERSEHCSML